MNRERPGAGAEPAEQSGLESLLAAERRLDRELAEARSRGEELVAAATAEVARQRERFTVRVEAAQERLGAAIAQELTEQIATIASETERLLGRYERAAAAIDDLAAGVARRVVHEILEGTAGRAGELPP